MKTLRLLAMAWAALSIGFVLFMFFGEWLGGDGKLPAGREWLFFSLFPLGVCLGLLLGFVRPRLGGAVAVLSLLGFYAAEGLLNARLPGGPWFLLVAAPGLLFLLDGDRSRGARRAA